MAEKNPKNDQDTAATDDWWPTFYARESPGLTRFLAGVLKNAELARDVAQVAFTRLLERRYEVKPNTRRAWLYRVALREALDQKRRAERGNRAHKQLYWLRSRGFDPSEAADAAEQAEQIERVRRELEKLPPEQRQVVRMRIYQGKTFAQIAEELDIPLGTALSRMRAALGRLRKRLDQTDQTSP